MRKILALSFGFCSYMGNAQQWEYYTNFQDTRQIIEHQGSVFITSQRGVISFDPAQNSQTWYHHLNSELPDGIPFLGLDENGTLWARYSNSMWRFNDGSWSFVELLDAGTGWTSEFLFNNGDLWYATSEGLACRSQGIIIDHTGVDSPLDVPTYYVNGIEPGVNGEIWVATNGAYCDMKMERGSIGMIKIQPL
jgi:ligand-binding sensor domain-containing protein